MEMVRKRSVSSISSVWRSRYFSHTFSSGLLELRAAKSKMAKTATLFTLFTIHCTSDRCPRLQKR